MLKKKSLSTVAGILLVILLITAGCSGQSTPASTGLQLVINDTSNKPLSGAKVVSETQPEGQLKLDGITIQDGTVTFNNIKPGRYLFSISRFDYQPISIDITVPEGNTPSITLTLQTVPPPITVPVPTAT